VLNGVNEIQRIILLGGKSDLGISVLEHLPLAKDAEVFLCGRNISTFSTPTSLVHFVINRIEIDFNEIEASVNALNSVFKTGDIDLVIFAYSILGNEDLQLSPDLFKEVLHTNFSSQAIILNNVNSTLRDQGHGQILLFSTVAGMRPRRRNFVYGASKFGIDFIAQGLQKENLKKNVFITIIRPGFVHTKMTLGVSPAPFATNRLTVAKIARKGLLKKKPVVYAPKILIFIMFVLKLLPERIYRIVDK